MIELAPHHKRGLGLRGPVMNATGVLGFAGEYRGLVDFAQLGAFVTNPLTASPRTPARPPNVVPLPRGVLIHTGLPNPGVRAALRQYAREWQRLGPPVLVHLAATTPDEVQEAVEHLDRAEGVSGIELGLRDDVLAEEVERLVRAALGGPPLVVRLPVVRAAELCRAAALAGADALTVGAPPRGTAQVGEQTVKGRLYGPENFAATLEAVQAVLEAMHASPVPVIGAGGIFSVEHAQAVLAAGAVAFQVDAAVWNDPGVFSRLGPELK